MARKHGGWRGESYRHSLAAHGISSIVPQTILADRNGSLFDIIEKTERDGRERGLSFLVDKNNGTIAVSRASIGSEEHLIIWNRPKNWKEEDPDDWEYLGSFHTHPKWNHPGPSYTDAVVEYDMGAKFFCIGLPSDSKHTACIDCYKFRKEDKAFKETMAEITKRKAEIDEYIESLNPPKNVIGPDAVHDWLPKSMKAERKKLKEMTADAREFHEKNFEKILEKIGSG